MIYLLNWRMWVAAGFFALLPILYVKGRTDGQRIELARVAAARAQADNEARALERRRQDRVAEAQGLAAARAADDRNRAASADRTISGLRSTLDATERAAKESAATATRLVSAYRAVFESCTAEYRALGEEAAGHASDSLMLQQAWPK